MLPKQTPLESPISSPTTKKTKTGTFFWCGFGFVSRSCVRCGNLETPHPLRDHLPFPMFTVTTRDPDPTLPASPPRAPETRLPIPFRNLQVPRRRWRRGRSVSLLPFTRILPSF